MTDLPRPHAPAPDPRPTLSLDELKRYIGDDPESIQEFLREFQQSATVHAASLRAAMTQGDATHVAVIAHTLKSTARASGAAPLGDLLAELEVAAKRQDNSNMDRYFGAFLLEFPKVERRVAELLAAR